MQKKIPFVTIIMPVQNEARFIGKALEAALQQDYSQNQMEIVVADGMSTDGTREIVKSFCTRHENLRLVDNPKKIAASGLNVAIREAKGHIIVRVDGHTELAPDYVRACVEELSQSRDRQGDRWPLPSGP